MLLNSAGFLAFLAVVVAVHWLFGERAKAQNAILLFASLVFYTIADPRYLPLILFVILANYGNGLWIHHAKNEAAQGRILWFGVLLNLAPLIYFKYLGQITPHLDLPFNVALPGPDDALRIIIPLGISFYSLQMIGYLIDIHNEEIEPTSNVVDFLVYGTFFPKILAGPVEPARNMLPQLVKARHFDPSQFTSGLQQFLWGLFAKTVIADPCGTLVEGTLTNPATQSGSTLLLGSCLYVFQLYFDFSGYSNMAVGTAKLVGIDLMHNFRTPLFATNISDLWKRWHISLTMWLLEYVYTPCSFLLRDLGRVGIMASIMLTFLLVGIWHHASWPLVVFGLVQGLAFIPLVIRGKSIIPPANVDQELFPGPKRIARMALLFVFMALSLVITRTNDLGDGMAILKGIFSTTLLEPMRYAPKLLLVGIALVLVVEWIQRSKEHALVIHDLIKPRSVRWGIYYVLVALIAWNSGEENVFIYQQF